MKNLLGVAAYGISAGSSRPVPVPEFRLVIDLDSLTQAVDGSREITPELLGC